MHCPSRAITWTYQQAPAAEQEGPAHNPCSTQGSTPARTRETEICPEIFRSHSSQSLRKTRDFDDCARGARDGGGAEQRPLRARSLLRLRRSAPPARTPSIGSRVRRQAWRRGEARRRRRAREWSACGEADGRWPTGDEAREQPTPDAKDIERLRRSHRAVSGGARRSRPRAGCKAPALAPPRRAFFN